MEWNSYWFIVVIAALIVGVAATFVLFLFIPKFKEKAH